MLQLTGETDPQPPPEATARLAPSHTWGVSSGPCGRHSSRMRHGGGGGEWLLARWRLGCSPYTRGQSQAARAAEATSPPAGVLEAGARRAGSPEASLAGRLLRAPRVTPLCVCVPVAPSLEDTGHVAPAPTPVTSLPPF